jgi:hypothetical protein
MYNENLIFPNNITNTYEVKEDLLTYLFKTQKKNRR